MNKIAYNATPSLLAGFLQQIWPLATQTYVLQPFDAGTPCPTIILGNGPTTNNPCLVISPEKPTHLTANMLWVAAPINTASLVQHVRLWLAGLADAPLTLANGVVFNPRTRQFGPHILTEKEVATLQFLRAQPNLTATRAALQQHVWGYATDADTHTVETHIYRLRQKIEVNPTTPQYVVTNDDGYCLVV
jgi:hypothetical protein